MPIDSARVPAFMREEDVVDGLDYVDRYDEEVAYVDVEVGRLLRGFARRRSIEDSLVIFTADHGESLLERERLFSHGFEIFEEVVRVPLLFHGPGVVSGQYDVPVSGIDVHTTILRFAGGVSSKGGWDLRNPAEIPRDRRIFFESVTRPLRWHAVVEGQRKWALRVDAARQPERVERFHLGRDPGELQAEAVEVLEPALEALLDRIRRDPAPAGITAGGPAAAIESDHAPDLDARAREKLRALGYLD